MLNPECPNCAGSLAIRPEPKFCPTCGQPTALHPRPLDSVRETLARYGRTLFALVLRPGRLTTEFAAGRRVSYLPPLRLYLTASFLFFLAVQLFGVPSVWQVQIAPGIDAHGRPITPEANPEAYRELMAEMKACAEVAHRCSWWRTQLARFQLKAVSQMGNTDAIGQRMLSLTPKAVFVLLPAFAAIVMLAYRARRIAYGAHLVFSLHMHAFAFLALLVLSRAPMVVALAGTAVLALYGLQALRVVYGGRWWATLARAATIMVFYAIALLISMQVLGIASIMLA